MLHLLAVSDSFLPWISESAIPANRRWGSVSSAEYRYGRGGDYPPPSLFAHYHQARIWTWKSTQIPRSRSLVARILWAPCARPGSADPLNCLHSSSSAKSLRRPIGMPFPTLLNAATMHAAQLKQICSDTAPSPHSHRRLRAWRRVLVLLCCELNSRTSRLFPSPLRDTRTSEPLTSDRGPIRGSWVCK